MTNMISIYNLFYLFLSILWSPLQVYYLRVDGAGRTMMFFSMIAVFLNLNSFIRLNKIFKSPAFLCWTILGLYAIVNSMIKGFDEPFGTMTFIRNNFIDSYIFLSIAIIEHSRNKYHCLKIVWIAQLVFLVMGLLHLSLDESGIRLEADTIGNMLPLTAVSFCFVSSVLLLNNRLRLGWSGYIIILFFTLYIIVSVATRKAFGAIVFIVLGVVLGKLNKMDLKNIFWVLLSTIIIYWGIVWIMDNTLLGNRIEEAVGESAVNLSDNPQINNFLLSLLGDRASQYYEGNIIFLQHPITGIGLTNYMAYSSSQYRLHTEYMVQLCENGLIGIILLLLFYSFLIIGLFQMKKSGRSVYLYFFGLLAIFFINLTAWTYCMNYVMIIYAVLISDIQTVKSINNNSHYDSNSRA